MVERSLIIRPNVEGDHPREVLDRFADFLREDGFEVRIGRGEVPWTPSEGEEYETVEVYPLYETVCIWLAQGAVEALGGAVTLAAVKAMRDRFRKESDEGECVRLVQLIEDQGREGKVVRIVELEGAETEPFVRELSDMESFTRAKPPEM